MVGQKRAAVWIHRERSVHDIVDEVRIHPLLFDDIGRFGRDGVHIVDMLVLRIKADIEKPVGAVSLVAATRPSIVT